jgi:hypothetical protein
MFLVCLEADIQVIPELRCDCILLRFLIISHTTGIILILSMAAFYNEPARIGNSTMHFAINLFCVC